MGWTVCKACGKSNDANSPFCGHCGTLNTSPQAASGSTAPLPSDSKHGSGSISAVEHHTFCTHCGEANELGAHFCGNCGTAMPSEPVVSVRTAAPRPAQPPPRNLVLNIAVVAVVLILVIAGIRSVTADHSTEGPAESAGTIAPVQQPAAQFMASQIVAEYEANEVAADGRYKGRTIVVSGTIETIGKDISDTPYVTLKGGEYEFRSVQAFFEEKDLAQLAQLRKGQDVYIEGTCAGLMMNVLLKGSRLVERTQR